MSQYLDFIDYKYKPKTSDLICLFKIEPSKKINIEEVIGRVASESSNGTWTTLSTLKPHIRSIRARAFEKKKIKNTNSYYVKIAYPGVLFEKSNMPQIYSSVAGNIFGMKAVKNLRLEDIEFPEDIIKSFKGPQYGIDGIRNFMKVKNRPLIATVPKPKVGMTTKEHTQVAYDCWLGGVDFLKDDENLTNQDFNKFLDRVKSCAIAKKRAEKITGEKKDYFINITAETNEMLKRAKIANDYGFKYVMIDIVTTGWSGLQTLRDFTQKTKQAIHAHRAMHAVFTRNKKHGISMKVLAKTAKIIGVDNIHTGTIIGKLVGSEKEVLELNTEMQKNSKNLKSVFPCSSGGLHPGLIPQIIKTFGNNIVIQAGGGINGHPNGSLEGAKSIRQAIDASIKNISLKEYSKTHKELKIALEKWGNQRPV